MKYKYQMPDISLLHDRTDHSSLLKKMLLSDAWQKNSFHVPVIVGQNMKTSEIKVIDFASAGGLSLVGNTGSGKTCFKEALITCLIFKFSPDELKFVFIDPKVIEFYEFEKITHSYFPSVANSAEETLNMLTTILEEMKSRMTRINTAGIKDIYAYKSSYHEAEMPYIAVLFNEYIDFAYTEYAKEIESSIQEIIRNGEKAGVFLLLSTSCPRPVTDGYRTGIQTHITLETKGYGKLRYLQKNRFMEIQSPYCSCNDFRSILEYWGVIRRKIVRINDELTQKAIELICRREYISTSYLQRTLNIGYITASDLIEEFEKRGIVGQPISETGRRRNLLNQNETVNMSAKGI